MPGGLTSPYPWSFYDVDHFKQINDAHGHQVGDDVLIKLSGFVAKRMRETDLLARWGGEEFVILLPLSDASMAERFAEILRGAIATLPFDHGKAVTCSFGVAQLAVGESAERLVARADEALYRAKLNGRNRVETASTARGARGDHLGCANCDTRSYVNCVSRSQLCCNCRLQSMGEHYATD